MRPVPRSQADGPASKEVGKVSAEPNVPAPDVDPAVNLSEGRGSSVTDAGSGLPADALNVDDFPESTRPFLAALVRATGTLRASERMSDLSAKVRLEELRAVLDPEGFGIRDVNVSERIDCAPLPPMPEPAAAPGPCWGTLVHLLYLFRTAWRDVSGTRSIRVSLAANGFWIGIEPAFYVIHVRGFGSDARLAGIEYLVDQRH